MTRKPPQHGERRCYLRGCRRPECLDAHYRYMSRYRLDRQRGTVRRVPAGPAVEHVRNLHAVGWTVGQIAIAAGCGERTISDLRAGKNTTVRADIARLILNARPDIEELPGRTLVDATGTVRRIRALMVIGYQLLDIAAELGVAKTALSHTVNGRYRTVAVATAVATRRTYRTWSRSPGTSMRARNLGAKRGWAPPAAWDDDTIDDPNAHPDWTGYCGTDRGWWTHRLEQIPTCEPCQAAHEQWLLERKHLSAADRYKALGQARGKASNRGAAIAEDARELMRLGADYDTAARRIGVTRQHLQQELCRHPDQTAA